MTVLGAKVTTESLSVAVAVAVAVAYTWRPSGLTVTDRGAKSARPVVQPALATWVMQPLGRRAG